MQLHNNFNKHQNLHIPNNDILHFLLDRIHIHHNDIDERHIQLFTSHQHFLQLIMIDIVVKMISECILLMIGCILLFRELNEIMKSLNDLNFLKISYFLRF